MLTGEERRKIEAEEHYRTELRAQSASQEKPAKKRSFLKSCLAIFIGVPLLAGVIVGIMGDVPDMGTDSGESQELDFRALVNFDGAEFEITSLEDYDCPSASLVVNSKYRLEGKAILAGGTYAVGAAQFTTKDGKRLNVFEIKPKDIIITCKDERGFLKSIGVHEFK